MSLRFRDARLADLDTIFALNQQAGISVTAIDRPILLQRFHSAAYFRVAESNGSVAGFLIGSDQDDDWGNTGFQWFKTRHRRFAYIDRIVIAQPYRGHGLGRVLYADMISFAEVRVPTLGCQVSLEPRDNASMLFHASMGFSEVAQLSGTHGGRLAVMERALCSYPFVNENYYADGHVALPALPWLAARQMPTTTGSDNPR